LTERYYSWQDAQVIAKTDPEIDLSGDGPAFTPMDYVEDEVALEEHQLESEGKPEQILKPEAKPEQKISIEPEVKPEQRSSPIV